MSAHATATTPQVEKLTIAQAVKAALRQEMQRDERVIILGEDVGKDGGVFRATEGLLEEFGEHRVMDTPLAESGIVGASIGLALAGFKPVAEIQFTGFVYPALNQLLAHAARYRNRTQGLLHLPMVVRMPYGGGIHAPEHHSESYESIFLNTPGLKVVIPSNPYDAKGLLAAAIRDEDPVIFMEPKLVYRAFRQDVPVEPYMIEFGTARVAKEGTDVSIIAYGAMVRVALEAADALGKDGVSADVLDLRTLNPLDKDAVIGSARKTGRVVIVHEAPRTVGFGAELSSLITEHALLQLLAPVQRVTGFDVTFPLPTIEGHYMPSAARVVRAARAALEF